MDRLRVGRSVRVIRIRLGLRQEDLATAARVSRPFISKLERGLIGHDIERLDSVCRALGAELDVRIRWRGEGLDRLLDEAHADLVERVIALLRAAGWETAVEVTFSEFGERGSIDVLAWHAESRALLVVEVKSIVSDAQATLAPLDRKARLGRRIGELRGWQAGSVSRLLVVWDSSANRRRVARLGSTFDVAFPVRGRDIGRWLRQPSGSMSALLFLPDATPGSAKRRATGRQRVRLPNRATSGPQRSSLNALVSTRQPGSGRQEVEPV